LRANSSDGPGAPGRWKSNSSAPRSLHILKCEAVNRVITFIVIALLGNAKSNGLMSDNLMKGLTRRISDYVLATVVKTCRIHGE